MALDTLGSENIDPTTCTTPRPCTYLGDHGHDALGGDAPDGVHRKQRDELVSKLEHVELSTDG